MCLAGWAHWHQPVNPGIGSQKTACIDVKLLGIYQHAGNQLHSICARVKPVSSTTCLEAVTKYCYLGVVWEIDRHSSSYQTDFASLHTRLVCILAFLECDKFSTRKYQTTVVVAFSLEQSSADYALPAIFVAHTISARVGEFLIVIIVFVCCTVIKARKSYHIFYPTVGHCSCWPGLHVRPRTLHVHGK